MHSLPGIYSRNRDTLPSKDAISLDTRFSSSNQLMFSMSLGDCCHVEGHCVDGVEPRNTAAEALLLVCVGGRVCVGSDVTTIQLFATVLAHT